MSRIDFCGGSYTLPNLSANAQRSVNLYPEIDELGTGQSKMTMLSAPGLASLLSNLDGIPRGSLEFNGNLYVVAGTKLYQINLIALGSPGVPIKISATVLNGVLPLSNDGLPASLATNENQLLIASGGSVYIYYIVTMNDSVSGAVKPAGTFAQVAASNFTLASGNAPVKQVAFLDSFFLALIANSQSVQISNVLDGANWIPGGLIVNGVYTGGVSSQIVVSVYPENVIGMAVDHRVLWLFGRKKTVGYVSGDPLNIFSVQPGSFIEQGAIATFAINQLDNATFWVSGDDKGDGVGHRLNGLTPQRITTHAIEAAWRSYPKRSDAVSYSYQDGGHLFWQVLFPSANKGNGATWVYDTSTQLWHERDFLNEQSGAFLGHPSWIHAYWNGTHIVGDWRNTTLYQMDSSFYDTAGVPMRKLRSSPHVATELEMIRYDRFILDAETGNQPTIFTTTASPSTITLQDSGSQLWSVWLDPSGQLQTAKIGAGVAQSVILNDPGNTTTWQLGITTLGLLTTTSLAHTANPIFLAMNNSSANWNLQVTSTGLLQVVEVGLLTRAPLIFLRFSDDGGHTWSNAHETTFGIPGQFKLRIQWWRLGAARRRTFEITCSEAIPLRIVDAYINAAPGYQPAERLPHQLRKIA